MTCPYVSPVSVPMLYVPIHIVPVHDGKINYARVVMILPCMNGTMHIGTCTTGPMHMGTCTTGPMYMGT
jgi:hypothetical protein